jgi:hypothetical protein
VSRRQELRLYNESLAEYLVKQDITQLQMEGCDEACYSLYAYEGGYNSLLALHSPAPQWVHFPSAPYFTLQSSVEEHFAAIKNPAIKGFSVFWLNPLRYHKISQRIRDFIVEYAERHGLFYQEMASLNLRAAERKIVLVFSRERRRETPLPPFVSRTPPKNLIAFQGTFKMLTNVQHLREFILYHLNIGIDKFFLYDNDR